MKTAIYIEDGTTQVVLTPETEWEKKICKQFHGAKHTLEVFDGTFYECSGGWIRMGSSGQYEDNRSLIIRINDKPQEGE